MTEQVYRDPFIGIRARLVELAVRIQEREAGVTQDFWEALSAQQRSRFADLRAAMMLTKSNDFEQLARAEGMLAAYLEELDQLVAMLPTLEADWATVPDEVNVTPLVHTHTPWAQLMMDADTTELRAAFEAMVKGRDEDAVIQDEGRIGQLARFRDHDAPFVLRAVVLSTMSTGRTASTQVGEVGMTLFTSIRRALPRFSIRHENIVLAIGKALGIKDDVEVGDPSFDGLFLIEGSQEAADLFLTPAVRTHLLTLARFDVPTLTIDPDSRLASIQWRFEPAPKALEAAIKVLLAVRLTPPFLRFRSVSKRT